ncbi:MAG: hypothetical protein HYR62_01020 [Actinobacteria bacterium]|nr:hypothetical protein [Actinomycetota bacterium]MBI3686641.1 hypothetical protein [Actinomycetota bacterium]
MQFGSIHDSWALPATEPADDGIMDPQIWIQGRHGELVRTDQLVRFGVVDAGGIPVAKGPPPGTSGSVQLYGELPSAARILFGEVSATVAHDAMAELVTLLSSLSGTGRAGIVSLDSNPANDLWQWNLS